MSTSSASSTPRSAASVPPVMGVRCYWALVTPRYPRPEVPGSKLELVFIHLDPVLSVHLARQKMTFIGRGVIEFIHPAEREQARTDLGNAIASDDLQGSVTRVRFARLSRLRVMLGAPPDEVERPRDASKVVEDDEWMVIDVVLNWIADGVLLAFFHAIRDTDAVANNDPHRKDQGWSNFCGTAHMAGEQIDALHRDLAAAVPPTISSRYPPTRVFQLHMTSDAPVRPGQLVFSWPPARPPGSSARFDGSYDADEYGDLMKGVDMDPSQLPSAPGEVRTTCTTRFGAKHSITSEGVYRHVTSVFIPYGSVIFACFQTTRLLELAPRSTELQSQQSQPSAVASYTGMPQQDWQPSQPHLAPGHAPHPQQQHSPIAPGGEWRGAEYAPEDYYDQRSTYPDPRQQPSEPHPHSHHHPYPTYPPSHPQPHPPNLVPAHPHPHVHDLNAAPNVSPLALAPPQRIPSGPTDPPYPTPPTAYDYGEPSHSASPQLVQGGLGMSGGASSRPLVRPPGNVECCRMCGTRESPEWRRNESGIKDLCNACGLRLARQVAKREGRQKPRKKKA
ncbi:hypothetical protein JCM24511_08653 [Saitozyma sp. JCM 24511]|nr:hypothetical protein JCM24511_08653 [Saitozyma sp. JCM 24511]